MMASFGVLKKAGVADPKGVASNIGITMVSIVGGGILGVFGLFNVAVGGVILLLTKEKNAAGFDRG